MGNDDVSKALKYHEGTKHSEISVRTSGHLLDWDNKPFPFKVYEGPGSTPLPRDFALPRADALESGLSVRLQGKGGTLGAEALAELLFFSAGLTRKVRYGSEVLYMRAASATGALYPIELYVIPQDIERLVAGVYHYNPHDFALIRLREGDFRANLASFSEPSVKSAPVTIALTSLAWRNSWKYQARSYRHWFWDAGVIIANLLAVASGLGLEARVVEGFIDSKVNELLGVEDGEEATVALVPVGKGREEIGAATMTPFSPIRPKTSPLSRFKVEYPEIWEAHHASSLHTDAEVRRWREVRYTSGPEGESTGPAIRLEPEDSARQSIAELRETILRRGSTRRFAAAPVGFSQFSRILRASKTRIPFDFLSERQGLIDVYLIANHVEGLPQGSYFFDSEAGLLRQLRNGEMRRASAYLCLEQPLFGDASVVFFLMTKLGEVLRTYGNRGYRAAQLEGGIRAGKIYLSAYSQGLGASGSTFYDDAVTDFFSPHAKDKATMIAVGVGVPAYRAKTGRVLPQFP